MIKVLAVIEKTLLSKCVSAGWLCCLSTVVPVWWFSLLSLVVILDGGMLQSFLVDCISDLLPALEFAFKVASNIYI